MLLVLWLTLLFVAVRVLIFAFALLFRVSIAFCQSSLRLPRCVFTFVIMCNVILVRLIVFVLSSALRYDRSYVMRLVTVIVPSHARVIAVLMPFVSLPSKFVFHPIIQLL